VSRDLPGLAQLLDEIRVAVHGGSKNILAADEWPVGAIAFGGQNLLLVRDHGHSVTLSIPTDQSWSIRTRRDWTAIQAEISRAVSTYGAQHPAGVSIADVVVSLDPRDWRVSFPGTPVPAEAWLERQSFGKVGLFQEHAHVRVVVWVGQQLRSRMVSAPGDLQALAGWLPSQLVDQRAAEDAAAAEVKRKQALPLPELRVVLEALASGKRISTGGGRYYETFYVSGGKLLREVFDEGSTELYTATNAELERSIALYPDRFREEL
jgi:hypothetical protein